MELSGEVLERNQAPAISIYFHIRFALSLLEKPFPSALCLHFAAQLSPKSPCSRSVQLQPRPPLQQSMKEKRAASSFLLPTSLLG